MFYMQKQKIPMFWFGGILAVFLGISTSVSSSDEKGGELFATVDGYNITEAVYFSALQAEAKRRYYHGRITEERLAELKKDVAEDLIDQVLLIHEAERLGLVPDFKKIELALEQFDQRYAEDEAWKKDRDQVLPQLKKQFESRELVTLLEKKVRSEFVLTDALKREFYNENPGLFIFPERKKVSLILKKVPPTSLSEEWEAAKDLLVSLSERIASGEKFSELAKKYSDDETASLGGDMGYQHKGMLHKDVEEVLSKLDLGELSKPIRLLQGYVLVRVEEVVPAQKIAYKDAEQQVIQLLSRKLSDERWANLLKKLRNDSVVVTF